MRAIYTAEELQRFEIARNLPEIEYITEKPPTPLNVKATGERALIRVQWAEVDGADGYRVSVATDNDMDTPNVGLFTVQGEKSREFVYQTGNNAVTRYFAVQAYKGAEFSELSSIVSAASTKISAPAILFNSNTRASVSAVSAIRTYSLPANTLGANDTLRIYAAGERSGNTAAMTLNIKWNGTGGTICAIEVVTAAVGQDWQLACYIANRNSTSSQIISGLSQGDLTITLATAAVDTTAAVDIVVDASAINAADTAHCDFFIVEYLPAGTTMATDSAPSTPPSSPPSPHEPPEFSGRYGTI